MTRELKLALIVGFSLVLFVAVLFADHMSKARSAVLPSVTEPSTRTASGPAAEIRPTNQERPAQREGTQRPAGQVDPGSPFGPVSPDAIARKPQQTPSEPGHEVASAGGGRPLINSVERETLPQQGAHSDNNAVLIDQGSRSPKTTPAAPPGTTPGAGPSAVKPEPSVVQPKMPEYVVEEGDSLYQIAKKVYKDPKHWKALQAYNRDRLMKDGSVRAGVTILVPPLDVLLGKPATLASSTQLAKANVAPLVTTEEGDSLSKIYKQANKAEPAPHPESTKPAARAATYKIQKDDTLTSISQRLLGSNKRVNDLIKANPDINPENMKVGTEIKIPA